MDKVTAVGTAFLQKQPPQGICVHMARPGRWTRGIPDLYRKLA